jgi:hypothetical protein
MPGSAALKAAPHCPLACLERMHGIAGSHAVLELVACGPRLSQLLLQGIHLRRAPRWVEKFKALGEGIHSRR